MPQVTEKIQQQQKLAEFQETQAKAKSAIQAADPLFKLENEPAEMTGDKAPAAVALLQSKLKDPNLPPDQAPRVQRLLLQAQKAQQNALAFDAAKAKMEQAVKDGDPAAAGHMLFLGIAAPSQMLSARNARFTQQAISAAEAEAKAAGVSWSAQKAEAQYKYATNPATQNTLNMVDA